MYGLIVLGSATVGIWKPPLWAFDDMTQTRRSNFCASPRGQNPSCHQSRLQSGRACTAQSGEGTRVSSEVDEILASRCRR